MVIDAQVKFAVSEQFKMDNNHPSIWCWYIIGDIANHPEIGGYKIVCVQLVYHWVLGPAHHALCAEYIVKDLIEDTGM